MNKQTNQNIIELLKSKDLSAQALGLELFKSENDYPEDYEITNADIINFLNYNGADIEIVERPMFRFTAKNGKTKAIHMLQYRCDSQRNVLHLLTQPNKIFFLQSQSKDKIKLNFDNSQFWNNFVRMYIIKK